MSNITRFDPFNEVEDLFKGLFLRPVRLDFDNGTQIGLKVDVTKSNDAYMVKAELPGVAKDDIQVTVDGNQVTISGEVRKEKEEKGEEIIRSERYYGAVSRSFMLPHEVDESKVVAKSSDGVLTLTLPMKAKSTAKKIAVH